MSFRSCRPLVGLVKPTMRPGSFEELVRLVPRDIEFLPLHQHVEKGSEDEFKGAIDATTGTFSGNLGVGGVLTYEDVTNIDSVGVITARSGIKLGATGANTLISGNATGIGIGTDSPGSPLEVSGGTAFDTATFNSHNAYGVLINLQRNGINKGFIGSGKNIADSTGGVDDVGMRAQSNLIFTAGGDTERMRISSQGFVTTPNQPAFHAYGNNSWTDYTGSDNLIKLLNSECNIGGHYKQSGTDEGKFVVPVNGTYYFYTTIYSGRSDNGQTDNNDYLAIYFYEDGNNLANKGGHHIRHYYNEGDRDSTSSMSYIRTCTAGEKFYVSITCHNTGYQVYGSHSAFGGYLIG